MSSPAQDVRDEHRELLSHVSSIRDAGDAVGRDSVDELREDLDEALDFLTRRLIPHAELEERELYPAVARAMGASEATRTMSLDHLEVARLTERLRMLRTKLGGREVGSEEARELRRALYGLYAIVTTHFAKEEEVYLPILERGAAGAPAR